MVFFVLSFVNVFFLLLQTFSNCNLRPLSN
uniref:Uncharacterized protein n=1 Tax=Anguilla anguilla TaxID=7936 RepID=A0A0E9QLW0_ANGAN